jgi:3-hydroxyisobutyrate dehydrogenase-like beta-hydroxyacid dehydrogenase
MGTPMALNLARKFPLTVWNRTQSKCAPLREAGAGIAKTPTSVLEESDVIFTMLFNEAAYKVVLDQDFRAALRGKTIVNTSSVSVDFSKYFADQVHKSGGSFIEMPVSGSRVPAEHGQLVGMLAGDKSVAQRIDHLLKPITKRAVYCGDVGMGLRTKYAANLYLITMTAGLAESMHLARAQGLDVNAFGEVLDASPMASAYSTLKVAKMIKEDWSAQAAINDCYNLTELIQSAAAESRAETPLMTVCSTLYRQAIQNGIGDEDMIAVGKVLKGPEDTNKK